jgi:CHAT domain-containing protein
MTLQEETMINRLKTFSYPLVHIASHFKFSPGNETQNKLLLGDGTTMSLSDIRKEGKLFDGVKLLVLSACQTGMGGNGEEIDGFARLARQCGAGTVIASLWSVDDESTKELMVKFYSILNEGKVTSKYEALRLAQLELAGLEDLIDKSKGGKQAASGKKTAYSQPYYWAPFIMMGNWR